MKTKKLISIPNESSEKVNNKYVSHNSSVFNKIYAPSKVSAVRGYYPNAKELANYAKGRSLTTLNEGADFGIVFFDSDVYKKLNE